MIAKCNVCGIEKDMNILEKYPWAEEVGITKRPIEPLLNIDCQPAGVKLGEGGDWKNVTLCHLCWHKLDPDMWTCQEHYETLNPITPYDKLPNLDVDND
jgi:hypothetical protein